jgi:hypothetical protein
VSDIRDWEKYKRSRWSWTSQGYERGFPRGCQFMDIDAYTEFNGMRLMIESKHYEGYGEPPSLPKGQRWALEREAQDENKTVLVVYGNAQTNDPMVVHVLAGSGMPAKVHDFRTLTVEQRREQLKYLIDEAMNLVTVGGAVA